MADLREQLRAIIECVAGDPSGAWFNGGDRRTMAEIEYEITAWLRSDEARQIVVGRISQLVQDGVCVCGTCLAEEIPARLAESLEQR